MNTTTKPTKAKVEIKKRYTLDDLLKILAQYLHNPELRGYDDCAGSCLYHTDDNKHCIFGAIICAHGLYDYEMEGLSINRVIEAYPDVADLFKDVPPDLLNMLQSIHDTSVEAWDNADSMLTAIQYGLESLRLSKFSAEVEQIKDAIRSNMTS